ncbi:MAG TPA: hypothetical protein VLS94_06980, partial [Fusibacter sp.]|nr:hypothetical protein [Fusibacter sp.]
MEMASLLCYGGVCRIFRFYKSCDIKIWRATLVANNFEMLKTVLKLKTVPDHLKFECEKRKKKKVIV